MSDCDSNHTPIDDIGFKPTPTRNYLFTIYDRSNYTRDILFDGALPLHESGVLLYEFYEDYLKNGDKDKVYYISVILDIKNSRGETLTHNIINLEPSDNYNERVQNCISNSDKLFETFDYIYSIFIDNPGPNKHVPKCAYRKRITFKQLMQSYTIYTQHKETIKNMNVDEQDEQVVNEQ